MRRVSRPDLRHAAGLAVVPFLLVAMDGGWEWGTRGTSVAPATAEERVDTPAASARVARLEGAPVGNGAGAPVLAATAGSLVAALAVDARAAAAAEALATFAPRVARTSHREALETAFRAYYNHRAAHREHVRKPYLFFVDMGLDNRTPRGWVFDMDALEVVDGPFTVAHGSGSSRSRNGVPTSFSNRPGSHQSSLGLYLAQETYTFRGRSGGRSYASVGLRMKGESGRFNDQARRRGIVSHGAPYVSARDAGRSEGCPAMEPERARRLLPLLADGGVVFLYSPHDTGWLRDDPWIHAD